MHIYIDRKRKRVCVCSSAAGFYFIYFDTYTHIFICFYLIWDAYTLLFFGYVYIGYIRVLRPGSILGPQQQYLQVCICERKRNGGREREKKRTSRVTYSDVWHDSFIRLTWLIHTWATPLGVSFICETWLIHECDMTHS